MIKLINAQCPKCGAIMEVPEKLYTVSCIRCGSKTIVPKNSGATEILVSPLYAVLRELPGERLERLIFMAILILFPISIFIIFFTDLYLKNMEIFCTTTFIAIFSSIIILYNIYLAFNKINK